MSASVAPIDCESTEKLRIFGPRGDAIEGVDDWLEFAPPKKREFHWVDGRSAKELAKAWFREDEPAMLNELAVLLGMRDDTREFRALRGTPELVTKLDACGGEHRNHDLVVEGCVGDMRTVLCVEAKADESFGDSLVGTYYLKQSRNPRSRLPERVRELVTAIFGTAELEPLADEVVGEYPGANGIAPSPRVGGLRYQLLPAVGGTLIEATRRDAEQAVLIVHEFLHEANSARGLTGTQSRKVKRNRQALDDLLDALPDARAQPPAGDFLVGPFTSPGGQFVPHGIPLFVGKVTTVLF